MADKKPVSGNTGSDNPGGKRANLLCAEFEALLVDALDGTLSAKDAAAFEAHRATCPACAQLYEEAKRGSEWLRLLEGEPEVPVDLVSRILAQTSQGPDIMPAGQMAVAGMPVVIAQPGWLPGLERHAVQSRWMMTAAMAFFSIAFTLNLTGVRLSGVRLSDLKPSALASTLTRQFYAADAHVMRYYDNLRFVYELESRVREIKRDVVTPSVQQNQNQNQNSQPKPKKPSDGSAQKTIPDSAAPAAPAVSEKLGEPVMASLHLNSFERTASCHTQEVRQQRSSDRYVALEKSAHTKNASAANQCGVKIDRAERSLA